VSVLSEKNAVKALFVSVLASVVSGAGAANVSMYILPSPCDVWPQIVLSRPHWTETDSGEAGAGPVRGNDDNDPNIYAWEYYDQLASQTGKTVEATMDTHDVFLEALAVALASQTTSKLPDGSGNAQVIVAGETITSDANLKGPYEMAAGTAALLSSGQLTVKAKLRQPTN